MANPNGTDIQVATDSGFSDLVVDDSGAYRTSRNFVPDELPYGVDLYMRARHRHPETGTSAWSSTVRFQVISPANIIGVCLDNTPTKGVFYWIDAEGNKVSSFDFHDHPTYAGISMATTDASRKPVTLTKFPKFYVKTAASGPTNTFASGKKCWWISDIEATGFRPAACFKRSKSQSGGKYVISDYCYMGTYLGHTETVGGKTCIGSKIGQTVRASTTKANFKTYITNRNNTSAGETGYRMFDIWDLGALRMLLLIAKADSDTQTVWGDNTAGTSYPKTGSTGARVAFKGTQSNPEVRMDDLWRCYWYHADLISVSSGRVSLISPMDLTSSLSFGSASTSRYTQPTSSGWIRDVLDCPFVIGDDTHDLMELFLPKTVVSAENQATFSDYHPYEGASSDITVGGLYDSGSQVGVFAESDQPLEVNIPASHGACSTYCSFSFRRSRRTSTTSNGYDRFSCALGCGNSPVVGDPCPRSLCSASSATYGMGSANTTRYSYYYQPCDPVYSLYHGTDTCPNGWGTYSSYTKYQSGCNQGRYYPDARPAYTGPSDVVGSRLSKN